MEGNWYLPRGRIGRQRWWLGYVLAFVLLGFVTTWVDATWFPDAYPRLVRGEGFDVLWPFPDQGGPVTAITALLIWVPNIGCLVCRLHDRDHSAWWLLWFLVPVIGWLVLVVTIGFLRGTPGANQYGREPGTTQGEPWTS